jgi:hypothetical protein
MDETSQTDHEAQATVKVFCVSALAILVGLLALVFILDINSNDLKVQAQTQTIHETQK